MPVRRCPSMSTDRPQQSVPPSPPVHAGSHCREVSLFRFGEAQLLRMPRGWELSGERAVIRREGDRLVIEQR